MNRLGRWWLVAAVVLVGCGGGGQVDGGAADCSQLACQHGQCVASSSGPRCLCDDGFITLGNTCIPANPCETISCAALSGSHCEATDAGPSCLCEPGRIALNGVCTAQGACMPNPCTGEHQTACEVTAGQATCRCDPGYTPEGSGCSATPIFDCARRHSTGDNAEPDECPMLARVMPYGSALERTIEPAADHDWFKLAVQRDDVIAVTAGSQSMPLILEVFDATGTRVLAADTRGVLDPSTAFLAPANGTLLVRVRGVRGNDTGDYIIGARVVGADDYANDGLSAQHLTPGPQPLEGSVQYAGDVDVVWFALPAGEGWRFTSGEQSDAGPVNVVLELQRIDGGTALVTDYGAGVTVESPEEVLIVARGRNAQTQGTFSISMVSTGVDDFSDTPQVGPLLQLGQSVSGRLERLDDVDGLRLQVTEGHLYSVSLTAPPGSGYLNLSITDRTRTLFQRSSWYGPNGFKAEQTGLAFLAISTPQYSYGPFTDWTVRLDDLGVDDFTNTAPGSPITLGQAQTGHFELSGDVDVFRFTAPAQHVMRVALSPQMAVGNNVSISIFDSSGATLVTGTSPLQFLTSGAGDYDVVLTAQSSGASASTAYSLTVTDVGTDDFTGTGATATTLTVGTAQAGSIQYQGDSDEFAFTALANHVYEVDTGTPNGAVSLTLTTPSGVVNSLSGSAGAPAFLAAVPGRFVVTLSSSYYASTTQAYSLTVRDLGLEDHGETTATATALTLASPITGRIGFSADVDAFTFTATAQAIYSVQVTPSGFQTRVLDASGQVVNSTSYDGNLTFRAQRSGTYTVLISSYYASAVDYTLTVSNAGLDDVGDTTATASPLALDTGFNGMVQFQGDVDVFAVSVTGSSFYEASCVASQGCSIDVIDANGTPLGSGTYSSSAVSFQATSSSTVYARVTGSSGVAYAVRVRDLGTDDYGETRATAGTLPTTGATASGVISILQDVDAFTLAVTAGQILRIGCATSSNSGVCRMSLRNANDVLVAESNYGGPISVRVAQGGTWLLLVSTVGYSTTPAFTYELQANQVVDDHGDTNATATALALGALMPGTIDYTGDIDVFAFTVTSTTPLNFRVNGASSYQLQIRNAAGGIVAGITTWDAWTPPSAGTWYLWLTAPSAQSSAYSVQIQ